MNDYPFDLLQHQQADQIKDFLLNRPFTKIAGSFSEDAKRFIPGKSLETAINTAIAVGEPILITGEPGTGKTQSAYYAAFQLGIEPIYHFQVKSDSTAGDLLYHFDTVRYFHDANLNKTEKLNKTDYIEKRPLWEAFDSKHPRVLLIDEIDKAPRDFPNDLLHELDKMEFNVKETNQTIRANKSQRPIVFITSNSERRLPEPFLRRCVYHHIHFDPELLSIAVESRRDDYQNLSDGFIQMALQRFIKLRDVNLRKQPSTGELLVWLRVLALAADIYPQNLPDDLSKLPYLGVLLKDHKDIEEL